MNRTTWLNSLTLSAAATMLLLLSGAGCEDSEAQRRDETQRTLTQAVEELRSASTAAVADSDAARGKLQALAGKLAAVKDGAPGQKSTAALLAAEANETLGQLALAQAERLETAQAVDRMLLHTVVDVAGRLQAIASGRQAVSEQEHQAHLAQQKQQATARVQQVSQAMGSLDGPIETLRHDNSQDARQRDDLRRRSEALFRKAAEQGKAAGLDDYKQATELLRQSQQIERRMAGRDLDLQYRHQPAMDLAQSQVDLQQTLIAQIDEARTALDELNQDDEHQIAALQKRVADFRASVQQMRDGMNSVIAGELAQAYDSAASHFEQAAALADRAAGTADRAAAPLCRLAAVRARQMLAETLAARARGLADHAALLLRLHATGDALANPQAVAAELSKAAADRQSALEQAVTAVTAAVDGVDQASTRGNEAEIAMLKQRLQATQARLQGREPVTMPAPAAAATGADSPSTGAAGDAPGIGYPTPEDLLAALQTVNLGDPASLQRYADTWRATSASGRQVLVSMRSMLESMTPLMQALVERFGVEALKGADAGAGMGGQMPIPDYTKAAITSRTDDKATVTAPTLSGASTEIAFVKVDSLWYVSVESLLPKGQRVTAQELVAMQQGAKMMKSLMDSLAQRVRDDEFQSMEEVTQAMFAEMMRAGAEAARRGQPQPAEPDK